MSSAQLLPAHRDLYSGHPEMYDLEPWEMQYALQYALCLLGDSPWKKGGGTWAR